MRYLSSLLVVSLLLGCRSQTATVSNPFLSPNRVPPPATRTLLPGTAQPYYPGDPVTNSPAVGYPAAAYSPAPTQTLGPQAAPGVPQTAPPGGWNNLPQQAPAAVPYNSAPSYGVSPTSAEVPISHVAAAGEQPIAIQQDRESLRFATAPPSVPAPPPVIPVTDAAAQQALARSALPARQQTPQVAASYTEQPASFQTPVTPIVQTSLPTEVATSRQVQIREIDSSELTKGFPSRDGFRPRGSSRTAPSKDSDSVRPALSAVTSGAPVVSSPSPDRFGYDLQYQWLRGQLQYSATINGWMLRYVLDQSQPDQFGGSVMIANPQVLGELRSGNYIAVQGQLLAQPTTTGQMIPIYNVAVVQRQRQ